MAKAFSVGAGVEAEGAGRPVPPEIHTLLGHVSRALAIQHAAARGGDVAAVVTAPGAEWPALQPPHRTRLGACCAVLPGRGVRADAHAAAIAHLLEVDLAPGMIWCLVLWGEGDEGSAMLIPVRPLIAPVRGLA